jgi:hypothetical protein
MEILTLKTHGDGYIANNRTSIPNDPRSRMFQAAQEYLDAGGVLEPEFTQEELDAQAEALRLGKEVTMKQARLALLNAGLLSQVESTIAGLPSPDKEAVSIQWEYSTTLRRSHSWVLALADALGLTESQLDDLFTTAESLGS